jgi:hypothetical protein
MWKCDSFGSISSVDLERQVSTSINASKARFEYMKAVLPSVREDLAILIERTLKA